MSYISEYLQSFLDKSNRYQDLSDDSNEDEEVLVSVDEFVEQKQQKNDNNIENRKEYVKKLNSKYQPTGCVDPSTAMQVSGEPISCAPFNVLGVASRREVNYTYVLDIESWGLQPNKLHFGVLMNVDDESDSHLFRTWHNTFTTYKEKARNGRLVSKTELYCQGIIEYLEDLLFEKAANAVDNQRIHVYAHNGEKFDWVGLAWALTSNVDLHAGMQQLRAETRKEKMKGVGKQDKLHLKPIARPFMKQAISSGNNFFRRVREYTDPKTGKPAKFTWHIVRAGQRHYLEVVFGYHRMRLLDSTWHLPIPLAKMPSEGLAKGETPLQYTQPEKWLEQEVAEGRLVLKEGNSEAVAAAKDLYWFQCLSDEAVEYCKNDCRVLANALKAHRRTIGEQVRDPLTGKPLDPLAYTTLSQLALACMVIHQPSIRFETDGLLLFKKVPRFGWAWTFESRADQLVQFDQLDPVWVPKPYAQPGSFSFTNEGWYCFGEYVTRWKSVQYGGRTEVFQPMSNEGMRVISIDANSMYASVMRDGRYLDPRLITPLEEDLVGKQAIQAHLDGHSGMYLLETARATNPIIDNELPIFPVRLGGEDYDARLMVPTWEGTLLHWVTGEELRYFLQVTDVEGDQIKVHANRSLTASLLKSNETPFHKFATTFYEARKKALEEGDTLKATCLKMLLNSGGYGVLTQMNDDIRYVREGDTTPRSMNTLVQMMAMSPEWPRWRELDEWIETPEDERDSRFLVKLTQAWAMDHYRAAKRCDVRASSRLGTRTFMQVSIDLPSHQATHAIRPWGCAIAATGRVALHKALMAVRNADSRFGLLYCDTDSVHLEVPKDMTDEEVIRKLEAVKLNGRQIISLGNDLGQWKIEPADANPALVTEGADIQDGVIVQPRGYYLAPKNYYLVDKHHNVLKDVVKTIPKNAPEMRCTMIAHFPANSRLGDPKGVHIGVAMTRNLADRISSGKGVKRNYLSPTSMSKPIRLKNLTQEKMKGMTCIDYISELSLEAKGESLGIRMAMDHYVTNAKIKGQDYFSTQRSINERIKKDVKRVTFTAEERIHENLLLEYMYESGLYTKIESDDGLPF